MKTVRLGKTGLEVSRIGIGGIAIQRPPLDEAIKVIRRALDLGVNFIDTAIGYGDSEERIGKAVAGRREHVFLATKGGADDKATTHEHIEQSLKRLETDYIDVWQFHGINTFERYEHILGPDGAMEAAQEALHAGKIRHIGFSAHTTIAAIAAMNEFKFDTVMFPINFVEHFAFGFGQAVLELAHNQSVSVIAIKPTSAGAWPDARPTAHREMSAKPNGCEADRAVRAWS